MSFDKHTLIYRSGDVFLSKESRAFLKQYWIGNDRSLFYITNWTLVHALSGVVIGIAGASYLMGFFLHALWELWQIFIGMTPLTLRGAIDTVVDTAAFMAGMWVARKGDPRVPPAGQTTTKIKHAPTPPYVR